MASLPKHRGGCLARQVRGPHLGVVHDLDGEGLHERTQDLLAAPVQGFSEREGPNGQAPEGIGLPRGAGRRWPSDEVLQGMMASSSSKLCTDAVWHNENTNEPDLNTPEIALAPSNVGQVNFTPFQEGDSGEVEAEVSSQRHEACTEFQQVARSGNSMRGLRATGAQDPDSRRVREIKPMIEREAPEVTLTGPKYSVPDIVYAPSDVDPEEVLHVPDDTPSQLDYGLPPHLEHLNSSSALKAVSMLKLSSWNVAGIDAKRVKTLISADLDVDVVALQEYPKMPAGWHHIKGERFNGLLFQNYYMYRAVGILFDAKKFHLRGRRSSERGAWVQLQHVETSKVIWIGSIHLPNSEGREACRRLLHQLLSQLPKGATGAVLGDFNTQFRWTVSGSACVPGVVSGKWSDLRQCMAEYGFQQTSPPQHQAAAPTFHS